MTPSTFAFFIIVFGGFLSAGGSDVQKEKCPENCSLAEKWCAKVFARGGKVSSRNCGEFSFECTCNDVLSIIVNYTKDTCTWEGDFNDAGLKASYCLPQTALCPAGCSNISFWTTQCVGDLICSEHGGNVNFNCTTCEGQTYSIVGNKKLCTKHYSSKGVDCDPLSTCNGHGCCRKPGEFLDQSPCSCFKDPVRGFWAPPYCLSCEGTYDPITKNCTQARLDIHKILSSIGSTWTMVLPILVVLFLFVMLGLVRGECESDRSFQSTALRKTGLSAVQVSRRQQRGLFHTKYIPNRPAQSRSFANNGGTQEHPHACSASC